MKWKTLLRRLLASFVHSDGYWEVRAEGRRRLLLRRDEIVAPLFSPSWFLGLLFILYIGYVINIGATISWDGIYVLLAPAFAALWMATRGNQSNSRPESLKFDNAQSSLTIIESDGLTKATRVLAYTEIHAVVFLAPSVSAVNRVFPSVIIKPLDANAKTVHIDGAGDMVEVYKVIDEILPAKIERARVPPLPFHR